MKKSLLAALVFAGSSTVASAAACSGGSFNTGFDLFSSGTTLETSAGNTGTLTCAVTATPGFYITNVVVHAISDMTNGASSPDFLITLSAFGTSGNGNGVLTNLAPAAPHITGTQVVSTGGLAGNTLSSLTSISLTFSAASSQVNGVADGTSVNANGIIGTTGTAAAGCAGLGCAGGAFVSGVFFLEQRIPDTNIPEPATLSLVGCALVGLGLVARRKRN